MREKLSFAVWICLAVFLLPAEFAWGEEKQSAEENPIGPLQRSLEERDRIIRDLLRRVETLENEVRALRAETAGGGDRKKPVPSPKEEAAAVKLPPAPPPSPDPREREEEDRLARAALERILIQRSALLLPPWTPEIEYSLTYAHSSADRINIDGVTLLFDPPGLDIVLGEIVSERVRRDSIIPAFTLRLGLPYDLQTEMRVPLRYESERVLRADFFEPIRESFGLGDVEFLLTRQLLREKGWRPDLLGTVRWRTTTGETQDGLAMGAGFHGIQGILTALKVRDPVAFFGGISYTYNVPATRNDLWIKPGDTWGFNLGLALALTPESSISFAWDQRFTNRSIIRNEKVPGSALNLGTFRVGFTYSLTKDLYLDLGVAIGLTRDAPDLQSTLALPYRLPSLKKQ